MLSLFLEWKSERGLVKRLDMISPCWTTDVDIAHSPTIGRARRWWTHWCCTWRWGFGPSPGSRTY